MGNLDRSGRCPHFSVLAHWLPASTYGETCLPGFSCRLSQQFVPNLLPDAPPLAFGPDEQIVTPQTCTTARYDRQCQPAFDRALAETLQETASGTQALVEQYKARLKSSQSHLEAMTQALSERAFQVRAEARRQCQQTRERRQRFALQRHAMAA